MLSHASLSKKPVCLNMTVFDYSHLKQSSVSKDISPLEYYGSTGMGTQTFGIDGRPRDSDNDND